MVGAAGGDPDEYPAGHAVEHLFAHLGGGEGRLWLVRRQLRVVRERGQHELPSGAPAHEQVAPHTQLKGPRTQAWEPKRARSILYSGVESGRGGDFLEKRKPFRARKVPALRRPCDDAMGHGLPMPLRPPAVCSAAGAWLSGAGAALHAPRRYSLVALGTMA